MELQKLSIAASIGITILYKSHIFLKMNLEIVWNASLLFKTL